MINDTGKLFYTFILIYLYYFASKSTNVLKMQNSLNYVM